MKRTFLSMGVVALLAANTYGAGQVWYSATPASGDGAVAGGGPSGAALQLSCTVPSSWNITVTYDLFDGGATGWALDHYGDTSVLSASNVSVISTGFPAPILPGTTPNMNGELAIGQGGGQSAPGGTGPGSFTLMTFTLSSTSCNGNVWAGIGSLEFGGNDAAGDEFWELVAVGPNTPRPGYSFGVGHPDATEPNPVIVITPEPSTLALLALSGLAMIRRRK